MPTLKADHFSFQDTASPPSRSDGEKKSSGCEGRSLRPDRGLTVLDWEDDSWIGRATVAMAM